MYVVNVNKNQQVVLSRIYVCSHAYDCLYVYLVVGRLI